MSLVTADEDILFLPVVTSTPTSSNMMSDCTLDWTNRYETILQTNEVKFAHCLFYIPNYYRYCGNQFNFKYISSQIISYIPQQTTEDKGETDQMDSFSESDLQLADEIATAEIQFDTFTDEEIEIMVKTIPS